MSLDISDRDATVRDPRNAETNYRAEYNFTIESMYSPWLVEIPVGNNGSYRVTLIVERVSEET